MHPRENLGYAYEKRAPPCVGMGPRIVNPAVRHASPCLRNQLPKELCLPAGHEDLSLSSDLTHVSSSFPSSPLSPSITPSHFHSSLKTHFSTNLLLHSSTHRTDSTDSSCFFSFFFSGMSVLSLALCARLSWLLVSF